jgi:hypothetical protein
VTVLGMDGVQVCELVLEKVAEQKSGKESDLEDCLAPL